ncbi:MAG TPA: glutathione-disulfide reductase [Alphaproteobacteria bacterium]|nr:glutathione-disulfide reductase [Alphaproteobacteria bacterium]
MAQYDFDLFTIGAGSGGVAASRRAASYGARVAICENSRVGGTCVIRGCVPKKLLINGAQFRDHIEDAVGYGWQAKLPTFDWARLIANKDREIDRLNGIYLDMLAKSGVTLFEGAGRIVDAHTVEVGGRRYTTERILIATGGHPVRPDFPGAEHTITSDDAFYLPELPRKAVIIGGGYISCEFATIFSTLGSEVTVLVRGDELLREWDPDIRVTLAQELRKRGINFVFGAVPGHLKAGPGGYTLCTTDGKEFDADIVLAATGRRPNTAGLGLEAVGIETNARGAIRVDEWSRTAVPGIWAIGDVTDRVQLTPVAIAEGRAFAETEFNANPMRIGYDNIPSAVFSLPPAASVGLDERRAREAYGEIDIYRTSFRPMKHTLSGRDERIMMKLVVDRASQRVVGAHMVGADAPEMMQTLAIALVAGATKQHFDRTMALHPTAAEEWVLMREPVKAPEVAAQ